MNHESFSPIAFKFNLHDALDAGQLNYIQMHRWFKITGVKLEAWPGANICGSVYNLQNQVAVGDQLIRYQSTNEGVPSMRPIYLLWTPDVELTTSDVTSTFLEMCPKAKAYSPTRPIKVYKKFGSLCMSRLIVGVVCYLTELD